MRAFALVAAVVVVVGCGVDSSETTLERQKSRVCAQIAGEYGSALDRAVVCDPAVADACITGGSSFDAAVPVPSSGPSGIPDGLCFCPPGPAVTPAGKADLDVIIGRYKAAGCPMACPCPMRSPATMLVPFCTPSAAGGTCTLEYRTAR